MAHPAPIIACITKHRLLQEFTKAVSDVNRIHAAQVAAVMNDEGIRFQDELQKALDHKDSVKYALLAHQQDHGC